MLMRRAKNLLVKINCKIQCYIRRSKLKTKDFTIISNNCWGGFVYQYYGLKYNSPTIGLFFVGSDYVKFCNNIKHYIKQELEFIPFETSKNYEIIKGGEPYPVGRLDDIEIYFMHYKSQEEATEKWNRRCQRINWDNMIYKISQREGYTRKDIEEFMKINDGYKISFSYEQVEGSIWVQELKNHKGDEMELLQGYYDFRNMLNKDIRK